MAQKWAVIAEDGVVLGSVMFGTPAVQRYIALRHARLALRLVAVAILHRTWDMLL